MNICFFGAYDKDRNVNRVFLKGLKKIRNVNVIEINFSTPNLARDFLHNRKYLFTPRFFRSFVDRNKILMKKYFKVNYEDFDYFFIGYPGHESIYTAYFLNFLTKKLGKKRARIIFNPYTSLVDSIITDYRKLKRNSLLSRLYYFIEYFSFHLSDMVISHTLMEKNQYSRIFHLNQKKIVPIYLGADEELFYPRKYKRSDDEMIVGFNGNYIPLHGIDNIIKSAKIIENINKNIRFEITGGSNRKKFEKIKLAKSLNVSNIKFNSRVPIEDIPETIARSNIQLGIFGGTQKARRVIPNKVYTGIAMNKPVITANTPAIKELFTHKKDCYLCKINDSKSLADAILTLYEDEKMRKRIANNGYKLFKERLNSNKIAESLINVIKTTFLEK